MNVQAKYQALLDLLAKPDGVLVAFSAGVDSTLLLKAAQEANSRVLAVTAVSPLRPKKEQAEAERLTTMLGVAHVVLTTDELGLDGFRINPPDRCYRCKANLCWRLTELASEEGIEFVADGSNYDDLSEYRPGMRALKEWSVASPLATVGLTKAEIRTLSRSLALPTWDKPSSPCLATRFPYGALLNRKLLARVEAGEEVLRGYGFRTVRLRNHGNIARLELAEDDFALALTIRDQLISTLCNLGFEHICLDLAGHRSGSFDNSIA